MELTQLQLAIISWSFTALLITGCASIVAIIANIASRWFREEVLGWKMPDDHKSYVWRLELILRELEQYNHRGGDRPWKS